MSELPFQLGLNSSTLRGHKLPLEQVISIAAEAGYQAIEPWIDELDRFVAEGGSLKDLRKRFEDANLSVEGAIGFFEWVVDDDSKRKAGFAEARRNMELLTQIGGKRLAAPAFGATDRKDIPLSAIAERYAELCDLGTEYGIAPQVEVWGFSQTLKTLGEAAYVAIASGRRNACILADIYHLYKGGSGYDSLQLLSPAALPLFHVNDVPANFPPETITDADRVYTGDGVAPLTQVFRTLYELGFRGVLSLELFNEAYYRQDPAVVAKTGFEKLRDSVQRSLSA